MKHIKKLLLTLALLAVSVSAFAACAHSPAPAPDYTLIVSVPDSAEVTIAVEDTEETTLAGLLKELKTAQKISLEYTESTYGMYITSVAGHTNVGNEAVFIYVKKSGESNFTAAVTGADGITLEKGATYKLSVEKYANENLSVVLSAPDMTEDKVVAVDSTMCATLAELLKELKAAEKISFEYTDGEYGMYITSIEGYTPDYNATGEYISVYVKNMGETEFTLAVTGADGIYLAYGATYKFAVETYSEQ